MTGQLALDFLSDPSLYEERLVFNMPSPDPMTPTLTIRRCAIAAMELKKTPLAGLDESSPAVCDLKARLRATMESFIWQGYRHFYTSATQGIELWAAEIVIELREQYPGIALEMVIPYDAHSSKWPADIRARYDAVHRQADIVTIIRHDYQKGAIFARNRYLLDQCHLLVTALVPAAGSGTEKLAVQAAWRGKQVCRVPIIRPLRNAA